MQCFFQADKKCRQGNVESSFQDFMLANGLTIENFRVMAVDNAYAYANYVWKTATCTGNHVHEWGNRTKPGSFISAENKSKKIRKIEINDWYKKTEAEGKDANYELAKQVKEHPELLADYGAHVNDIIEIKKVDLVIQRAENAELAKKWLNEELGNKLLPWQKYFYEMIKVAPEDGDRDIHWVYNESGNIGKSYFTKKLKEASGQYICITSEGKSADFN